MVTKQEIETWTQHQKDAVNEHFKELLENFSDDPCLKEIIEKYEDNTTDNPLFNQKRIVLAFGKLARLYKDAEHTDLVGIYVKMMRVVEQMIIENDDDPFLKRIAEYQCELGKITHDDRLAEKMFIKSIEYYKRYDGNYHNLDDILNVCDELSLFYRKKESIDKAAEVYRDLLKEYEDNLEAKARIEYDFQNMYFQAGFIDQSEQIFLRMLKDYEQLTAERNEYWRSTAKFRVELGDRTKSVDLKERMYLSTIEQYTKYKDTFPRPDEYEYLTIMVQLREKLVGLYIEMGQLEKNDEIIPEILEGYEFITRQRQVDFQEETARSIELVGIRHEEEGEKKESERMYIKSAELFEKIDDLHSAIRLFERLISLDSYQILSLDETRRRYLHLRKRETEDI